jgi:hypothetical protein
LIISHIHLTLPFFLRSSGWIPTWIKNFVTRKFAPTIVEKMHKAASDYPKWKDQQTGRLAGRPWRNFEDKQLQ